MKRIPLVSVILSLVPCSSARGADDPPSPAAVPDAVKGITARELGGHMKFLASDLMRGRDTASPEIRLAAEYLASRLSAAGAAPAGEAGPGGKTYFQRFPLEVVTPQLEGTSVTLLLEQNGSKRVVPCQLGVDVTFLPWGLTPGEIEAPVVFAGFGQVNPAEEDRRLRRHRRQGPVRPRLLGRAARQRRTDGRADEAAQPPRQARGAQQHARAGQGPRATGRSE